MARAVYAGVSLAALGATLLDWQTNLLGFWTHLSGAGQTILVTFESIYPLLVVFQEGIPFSRKIRANRRISTSFLASGAPQMDPNQPEWIFKINPPGKFGQFLETVEEVLSLKSSFKGRHVMPVYLKAGDDIEAWVEMARVRAMSVRGLQFLNDAMRSAIIWHIVVERLKAAGAPTAVINAAKSRLEDHQEGPLYSSLFNPQVCMAVSLTKLPPTTTYFNAYFQPLMIAFDEGYFVESAGTGSDDELHAIMRHLNCLAAKRVAAVSLDGVLQEPSAGTVRKLLYRELPSGPQNKAARAQARRFNKNQAAKALLVVCTPDGLNQAEAFERSYQPDRRMSRADIEGSFWTPDTAGDWDHGCFLWQCHTD